MEPFILRTKHQEAVVGWMGSALFFKANRQNYGAGSLLNREEFYASRGSLKE